MKRENLTIYETVTIPLLGASYDVVVGLNMKDVKLMAENLYKGLDLSTLTTDAGGYTCEIISRQGKGTNFMVLIATESNSENAPSLQRVLAHEATHLSWYILDYLGIRIDPRNHEMQAFLVEEIVETLTMLTLKLEDVPQHYDDFGNL